MKIGKYESHEFADIFPMIEGDELNELKEDILKQGLLQSVVLYEGKILDGRNRCKACAELGIEPRIEEYKGDKPLEFVISMNLKRRHMDEGQRAALAVDLLPMLEAEAKKRQVALAGTRNKKEDDLSQKVDQGQKGKSTEKAGSIFHVNRQYVSDAKKLKAERPELFQELKKGNKKLSEIKQQVRKEKIAKQKESIVENVKRNPITGTYDVIVIDPPWEYNHEWSATGNRGVVDYPTMKHEELLDLKIPASDDCVLWLWMPNSRIKEAVELVKAWGFEHKSILTWDKVDMGVGHFLRNVTEHCLLCFKGKPYFNNTKWTTLISEKRTGHSVKPQLFYQLVDEVCAGRKLDYYARKKREGWDVFGDDIK